MTYEELSRELSSRSITQLLGLLQLTVRLSSIKPVFKDKVAMLRFVDEAWEMGGLGLAVLRGEGTKTNELYESDT